MEDTRAPWVAWRRRGLAALYFAAGVAHIALPAPFLKITPEWVPFPDLVILATGLCELAGATALLTARFRRPAGIALAAYAVCVYPANIKHAMDALSAPDPSLLAWAYHVCRLALQPLLVWWALLAGGVGEQCERKSP